MKSMWKIFGGFIALTLVATLAMGCGAEDPETVAETTCDSIDACEGQEAGDECVETLTESFQDLQDDDADCYDAFADAIMCGGGQCSADEDEDECSEETDAMEDACTDEQIAEAFGF